MASGTEFFLCMICNKSFAKRMNYNQHKKYHERPHPCHLCESAFGLKSDLERHRICHQQRHNRTRLSCRYPGCKFKGTTRKQYLWTHMIRCHKTAKEPSTLEKRLRAYYDDSIRDVSSSSKEEINLQFLEATAGADVEEIQRLLLAGADLAAQDANGRTAFILATERGHIEVFKLLLAVMLNRDDDLCSNVLRMALRFALERRDIELFKLLLAVMLNRDDDLCSNVLRATFEYVVRTNNEELVLFILEHGASPNAVPSDPPRGQYYEDLLTCAARVHRASIVELLLERGANVNAQYALNYAVTSYPDPDLEIMRIIIQAGADVEKEDCNGRTPLHNLIRHASPRGWCSPKLLAAGLLLKAGASLSVEDWQRLPLKLQDEFPQDRNNETSEPVAEMERV